MVEEYAPYGNLRDYLRQHHPVYHESEGVLYQEQQTSLTYKSLISFAYQVARGMDYLASQQVLNRFYRERYTGRYLTFSLGVAQSVDCTV